MPKAKTTSSKADTSGWTVNTFRSEAGERQFYFRICAANGEIVAASEGYKTKLKRNRTALAFSIALDAPMNEVPAPAQKTPGTWPFPTESVLKGAAPTTADRDYG